MQFMNSGHPLLPALEKTLQGHPHQVGHLEWETDRTPAVSHLQSAFDVHPGLVQDLDARGQLGQSGSLLLWFGQLHGLVDLGHQLQVLGHQFAGMSGLFRSGQAMLGLQLHQPRLGLIGGLHDLLPTQPLGTVVEHQLP